MQCRLFLSDFNHIGICRESLIKLPQYKIVMKIPSAGLSLLHVGRWMDMQIYRSYEANFYEFSLRT
jgi:hypothetical protein